MASIRKISPQNARRLIISRQHLAGPRPSSTIDNIYSVTQELGCLQLDPISVVARSHELVLFSRLGNYSLADIDKLLFKERKLFEYWAHEASIVLTEDYPIHHAEMRRRDGSNSVWTERTRSFLRENAALHRHILDEITQKGPMFSRQFEDKANTAWVSAGWTSGRNVARMISILWIRGELMVAGRKGIQKQWDLADRVLPEWVPRDLLSDEEVTYRAAQKSLRALGIGTARHIQEHYTRRRYPQLPAVLTRLASEGLIEQVEIDGYPGTWYIHCEDIPLLQKIEYGEWEPRTVLLSPFDNLICNRARTEALFNFYFRIEIYVPKVKRQYGYYVLPILHGDRLIGRIDPQMDRKTKTLTVNAVYAEPTAPMDAATGKAVNRSIKELADFLGAQKIVFEKNMPDGWRKQLK